MIDFGDKSENECREMIERSEAFVHRYMQMLDRFADLPACDEIIMRQLETEFPRKFMEDLREDAMEADDESSQEDSQDDSELMDAQAAREECAGDPEANALRQLYESLDATGRQAMNSMFQLMMNWAIVFSMVVPPSSMNTGITVMIALARSVGNMNGCFEAICDHNFNLGLVLSERSSGYWNALASMLTRLKAEWPEGREIIDMRMKDIKKVSESLQNFHQGCIKLKESECGF